MKTLLFVLAVFVSLAFIYGCELPDGSIVDIQAQPPTATSPDGLPTFSIVSTLPSGQSTVGPPIPIDGNSSDWKSWALVSLLTGFGIGNQTRRIPLKNLISKE